MVKTEERRYFEDGLTVKKKSWKEQMRRLGLALTGSGDGQESGPFKQDREIPGSIQCGEFPD